MRRRCSAEYSTPAASTSRSRRNAAGRRALTGPSLSNGSARGGPFLAPHCTRNGRHVYSRGMTTLRALGYVRVSTEEQARSGLGLEAQVRAIHAAAEQRG